MTAAVSRAAEATARGPDRGSDRGVVRGGKPASGEPVVDRALRLLSVFGKPSEALSLGELSTRAELPKATALRLARRLLHWGALERTEDGRFVVGLRLLEVASLSPRGHGLRAIALPYLEDLHHATGEHVQLAVRSGHEAVLLERLSSARAGPVLFRVGGRLPLHGTGVGLVLLAHASRALQEEVLAGDLRRPGERWPMAPDELRRVLARVRHDGVAVASLRLPVPATSVAAPVVGRSGHVVAALSVVAPSEAVDPRSLTTTLVTVARAVSRAVEKARGGARTDGDPVEAGGSPTETGVPSPDAVPHLHLGTTTPRKDVS